MPVDCCLMELFETTEYILRTAPQMALQFLVAVLCGGAVGMERETTGKPAGLRTCIVVCLGATLFTHMSITLAGVAGGDSTRIAAQIVTGIGFLGAGVIMHERRGGVKGVTTAAMIWLMAALGMMIGSGYLITAAAITIASVVMLLVLRRLELLINRRHSFQYVFHIPDDHQVRHEVAGTMELYDDQVENFTIAADDGEGVLVSFCFIGPNSERREMLRRLYQIPGLGRINAPRRK